MASIQACRLLLEVTYVLKEDEHLPLVPHHDDFYQQAGLMTPCRAPTVYLVVLNDRWFMRCSMADGKMVVKMKGRVRKALSSSTQVLVDEM